MLSSGGDGDLQSQLLAPAQMMSCTIPTPLRPGVHSKALLADLLRAVAAAADGKKGLGSRGSRRPHQLSFAASTQVMAMAAGSSGLPVFCARSNLPRKLLLYL